MPQHPTSGSDQQALAIVGLALRIARERSALSQRGLAVRSGVSQTAISRMERGAVRGMGLIYFARVARALADAMTFVGCPHGHDCDYDRRWRFALRQADPDLERRPRYASVEGPTLDELTRRFERDDAHRDG